MGIRYQLSTRCLALVISITCFHAVDSSASEGLKAMAAQILAKTCAGKIRLDILRPRDDRLFWRARLSVGKGDSFPGYFTLQASPPQNTDKPLQKMYPEYHAVLTQVDAHSFRLEKPARPDCEIEITDYGVLLAPTEQANGYGGLIAPLVLVYDEQTNPEDEYTWGQESPEVTEENWAWQALMHPIDSMRKIGEVLAGGSNKWADPSDESTGKNDDFIDEDGDGYDDRDYNRNGEVSDTEKTYYYFAPVRRFFGMD